ADKRARLIFSAIRFAKILKPKLILFENVPGLATPRFAKILKELRRRLEDIGYRIGEPHMADAADYGVPQRRQRCILIARLGDDPPPELPPAATPKGKRRHVRDAFKGLPHLKAGEKDPDDPLHISRDHHPITLRRLSHIPKNGGSRASLPRDL